MKQKQEQESRAQVASSPSEDKKEGARVEGSREEGGIDGEHWGKQSISSLQPNKSSNSSRGSHRGGSRGERGGSSSNNSGGSSNHHSSHSGSSGPRKTPASKVVKEPLES